MRHEHPMKPGRAVEPERGLSLRHGLLAGLWISGLLLVGAIAGTAGEAGDDSSPDNPKAGDDVEGALLTDLDVPLYEGMREEAEERVIFDSAEGRIIHARARGPALPRKLYDFYRVVLPSLGWTLAAPSRPETPPETDPDCGTAALYCLRAERDRESLVIGITRDKRGASLVSFVLTPE